MGKETGKCGKSEQSTGMSFIVVVLPTDSKKKLKFYFELLHPLLLLTNIKKKAPGWFLMAFGS